MQRISETIANTATVEMAEKAVTQSSHPSTHAKIGVKTPRASFQARFSWWPDNDGELIRVPQIVYAGDVFNTENRKDAIEYRLHNKSYCGIIQAMFQLRGERRTQIALVRRSREIRPEVGNEKVVKEHKMKRFEYCYDSNSSDVALDCVGKSCFNRIVMLVPDPWSVVNRH